MDKLEQYYKEINFISFSEGRILKAAFTRVYIFII